MNTITKENNQVKILDDRFYMVGEDFFPSVTTVLSVYPKGNHLTQWIAENGLDSKRLKMQAGEKGSLVHNAIEKLTQGQELSLNSYEEDEWRAIMSFYNFWRDYNPKIVDQEHQVTSMKYRYCGTLDASILVDGKLIRLDWKTSNHLYEEHNIQLVAYEMAEREVGKDPAEELWLVQLGTKTKKGYSLHKVTDWQKRFEAFLMCKALWEYEHPNAKPFDKQLPLTIKL